MWVAPSPSDARLSSAAVKTEWERDDFSFIAVSPTRRFATPVRSSPSTPSTAGAGTGPGGGG